MVNERNVVYMGKLDKLSVFISLVLRHKPDAAGIQLDEHGWANVDELIEGLRILEDKLIWIY